MFIKWLISHLLFAGTMFFAAGTPTLTDAGGEAGGGEAASGDVDLGVDDSGADDAAAIDDAPIVDDQPEAREEQPTIKEEPELAEFKGTTAARLKLLTKQAPELAQVFQKYPKVAEQVAAIFRREAALRDVFPTVAEARQMRETFPNGLADVQTLQESVQQLDAIDKDFYTKDREGNYSGHTELLNNMFTDDREAAVSLFKTMPKEWARLDRDSYNEVMGSIVGATLYPKLEFIQELMDAAKEAKQDGIAGGLGKLLSWANGFLAEKPRPSADEERLTKDRAAFNREKTERAQQDGQTFHKTFVSESVKLQRDVVSNHPAIKRLEKVSAITPDKRAQIVDKVREKMKTLLQKSPSFMKKLNPAYSSRNLQETISLQKAAWSQPWLLNRMVREVLRVETPAMVEGNRESVRRRAGAPTGKAPVKPGEKSAAKGPRQIGGRWYKEDGSAFSSQEILSGKHLS